jgi:hypothetical protein
VLDVSSASRSGLIVELTTNGFYKHSDSWTHLGRKTCTNKRAKAC